MSLVLFLASSFCMSGPARAACGDVNGDGAFGPADLLDYQTYLADPPPNPLSPNLLAQCAVHGRARPCDIINAIVMARNLDPSVSGPALGTTCEDGDQDGVTDDADLCRSTPPGAIAIDTVPGCANLDVVARPESLTEPAVLGLTQGALLLSAPEFGAHPMITSLRDTTQAAMLEMALATNDMRAGNVCAASASYRSMVDLISSARATVEAMQTDLRLDLEMAGPAPPDDHFGDGQLSATAFDIALMELDRGIAPAEVAAEAFDRTCADVQGALSVSGQVAEIDDALGFFVIDGGAAGGSAGGTVISLLSGAISTPVTIGSQVDVQGTQLANGTSTAVGLATDVTCTDDCDAAVPVDLPPSCLFLRIVPVQGAPPYDYTPITKHVIAAYEGDSPAGNHEFERGMRFTVDQGQCEGFATETLYPRYSMRIQIGFTTIANDLTPGDDPVDLPDTLLLETPMTLTTTVRKQLCSAPGNCGNFTNYAPPRSYPIVINQRGSLCQAVHSVAEFDLEDNDATAFDWQFITGISHDSTAVQPGDNPFFRGQSCDASVSSPECGNGPIIPAYQNVGYKILNDDFFPVHGTTHWIQNYLYWRKHGVRMASGIRWPTLEGHRNGSTYWYSCGMLPIVRDVVNYCSPENSYYRYPLYPGGVSDPNLWNVSRGNLTENPGHDGRQNFAWDITAQFDAQIRATRGGRVVGVKESSTPFSMTKDGSIASDLCYIHLKNCHLTAGGGSSCVDDSTCGSSFCRYGTCITPGNSIGCKNDYPCDNGNYVYVRHQDGTYATYWHMRENGVTPTMGQILKRSDEIGGVGDTGNSSENHLHYHVQSTNGVDTSDSIRTRFQTATSQSPDNLCQIPGNGNRLPSSNDPGDFY